MEEKYVELPGPEHPILIERNPARAVISVARLVSSISTQAA
jgi:hypothetical protein